MEGGQKASPENFNEGMVRTLPPSAARLLRDFDDVAGSKNLREQLQAMKAVRKFCSEMRGNESGAEVWF